MVVPPVPARETVWSGWELVIVKSGYVPLVVIPVPSVRVTVWSGAVLDMTNELTAIPLPAV
jgi:hypothetical protein